MENELGYISHKLAAKKAHKLTHEGLAEGKVKRPGRCQDCGRIGWVLAHHDDYDKPLDIRWLCGRCHNFVHREWWRVEDLMTKLQSENEAGPPVFPSSDV